MSSSTPIKHLYITLKRSFAGTPERHCRVIRALGLTYREQTVQKTNTASVRGAIAKVIHLLSVESDEQRRARLHREKEAARLQPPLRFQHDLGSKLQ
eukprot:jgi/Botrbrau1/13123/Bobra.0187s0080.1